MNGALGIGFLRTAMMHCTTQSPETNKSASRGRCRSRRSFHGLQGPARRTCPAARTRSSLGHHSLPSSVARRNGRRHRCWWGIAARTRRLRRCRRPTGSSWTWTWTWTWTRLDCLTSTWTRLDCRMIG
jgi:hypothetical protein